MLNFKKKKKHQSKAIHSQALSRQGFFCNTKQKERQLLVARKRRRWRWWWIVLGKLGFLLFAFFFNRFRNVVVWRGSVIDQRHLSVGLFCSLRCRRRRSVSDSPPPSAVHGVYWFLLLYDTVGPVSRVGSPVLVPSKRFRFASTYIQMLFICNHLESDH